jgi:hypothetical protein
LTDTLSAISLKYKMNFAFRVGFPNGPMGCKSVGICSEIRSSAEFKSRFAFVSAPFRTNEIPRTDPLVQVDYVRVVDLDIGASKSDIRAIRTSSFRSAPAELKPATAGWCRNGDGKR